MMAGLAFTGLWLLVVLTGAIKAYPTNKASDHSGVSNTNPSFGFSWEEPAHGFVHKESAFQPASNPVLQLHPDKQPVFYPGDHIRPVPAPYGSNVFSPPVHQGNDGGFPVGSTQSRAQSAPDQVKWAVDPHTHFSGTTLPNDDRKFSESPSFMTPPFRPGETSYEERTYEEGDFHSESEDEGLPSQYLPVMAPNEPASGSPLGGLLNRLRLGYPLYEYMLLNRRFPPGTYTLTSDHLEHRKNQRHDSRYIGDPYRPDQKYRETFSYPNLQRHPIRSAQQRNYGYGSQNFFG
ncbi:PREDICTED: uncharacterized protein LOC107097476 [Cyprinodon variegatus]|uniref:uncharacterized protein LOC107097476 n=1 Tax=Cyprinodon variegatus TaxID=28743 RepID=UPI0007427CFE|nr:PREDICTED: uncharacterized protein LOC107097476 [Cyprinodon variegatus]